MSVPGALLFPHVIASGLSAPGKGALVFPVIIAAGAGSTVTQHNGVVTIPALVVQGVGVHAASGSLVLPIFSFSATFGAPGTSKIPAVVASGTAHLAILGTSGITFGHIVARGTGREGQVGSGTLVIPAIQFAGTTHELPLGIAALSMPVFAMEGEGFNTSVYRTVVAQIRNFAVSEYVNFNFVGFCEYPTGTFLAIDEQGNLYRLYTTAGSDNGTLIDAELQFGTTDFGADANKNCVDGFVNFRGDGDLIIKALVDEKIDPNTGGEAPDIYHIIGAADGGLKTYKFKMSRFRTGRNWRFSVKNVNGSDFDLNEVAVFYDILSRRGNGH